MIRTAKNTIIKLLGGYTKEECVLKKGDVLDLLSIEQNYNFDFDNTRKAQMRACGVRFIENENLPSILINLKQQHGQKLLKNNDFSLIFGTLLSFPDNEDIKKSICFLTINKHLLNKNVAK